MRHAISWSCCVAGVVLWLGGCDGDSHVADDAGAGSGGSAGSSTAGRGGGTAAGTGGRVAAGSGGRVAAGSGGSGGAAGGSACPPNLAVPAICRMCRDGSCGTPFCSGGSFAGFRCPEDSGGLRWYETCGDPVCGISPDPSDDPNIPNCTSERVGAACMDEGALCDGVASCGASLICAASDPTAGPGGCPISRARFKQDIAYLDEQELHDYHAQLMSLPLASYRYKHAEGAGPQLGFIIEDIEPSVAVSGDHVNMYGYLSMAVAAIQVQQEQITSLQRELERLRAQLPDEEPACMP